MSFIRPGPGEDQGEPGPPARARLPRVPCALRRGVVDVVDVVGSSKAGEGGSFPAGRPVDITTESTESTESRFGGLSCAKRKEAVSVESVGGRFCRKAGEGGGFPGGRPVDDIDDIDDVDDPRTEGRRRRVPEGGGRPRLPSPVSCHSKTWDMRRETRVSCGEILAIVRFQSGGCRENCARCN